jgi:hypothetical protein
VLWDLAVPATRCKAQIASIFILLSLLPIQPDVFPMQCPLWEAE